VIWGRGIAAPNVSEADRRPFWSRLFLAVGLGVLAISLGR
jgi:hypothetical protein